RQQFLDRGGHYRGGWSCDGGSGCSGRLDRPADDGRHLGPCRATPDGWHQPGASHLPPTLLGAVQQARIRRGAPPKPIWLPSGSRNVALSRRQAVAIVAGGIAAGALLFMVALSADD